MRPRPSSLIAVVLGALVACGPGGEARPRLVVPTTSGAQAASTTTTGPRSSATTAPVSPDSTLVDQLIDGNTVVLAGGVTVRLVGVRAPETGVTDGKPAECFGAEAAHQLRSLLPPGSSVRLAYDTVWIDRSGHTLAYLYRLPDSLFVNAALIRGGYARAAAASSNQLHGYEFVALQRQARRAGRGLWSACAVTPSTSAAVVSPEESTTTTEPYSTTTTEPVPTSTTSTTATSSTTAPDPASSTTTAPPSTSG